MSEMIKVKLTGVAMCEFTRYMTIPKDELVLFGDEENIQCNLDEYESNIEIVEWQDGACCLVV